MRQYLIDELRAEDNEKLKEYFEKNFKTSAMEGIYWIPLDDHILDITQKEHHDCKPFFFAVELSSNALGCELLIRSQQTIRCDCLAFANKAQRDWLIETIDSIFEKLGIIF